MRAKWTERNDRPGWDVAYTVIGGRSAGSELDRLEPETLAQTERAVSQAFIAASSRQGPIDPEVSFWATVCRKIIQRGSNPVMHHAAIQELPQPSLSQGELLSAVAGPPGPAEIDPSFDLHAVHENPFWKRVVGADSRLSRWITPQAPLEVLAGRPDDATSRWVDFLLSFPWDRRSVVIEIDGSGHERQPGVDRIRDALLADAAIPVVRIPGVEVHSLDSSILRRIERSVPEWQGGATADALRSLHSPPAAQRLAYALVEAAERGFLARTGQWAVRLVDESGMSQGMEPAALDLIAAVDDIWAAGVVPDTIVINSTPWRRGPDHRFTRHAGQNSGESHVEIRLEPFVPPHAPLHRSDRPTVVIRGACLPVELAWSAPTSSERRNRRSSDRSDDALQRLLRDIYGYDDFREGQQAAVTRVLSGGDTCVLLPTGAGKSLIYQLAGLLRPGVTVIIAPLTSLIDDQVRRLDESGINRVTGLHSGTTTNRGEKESIQEAIASGESLFVLVAPERLQIEAFRRHLREAAAHEQINLAVVDEAHCVSEWGHQFRTSYLKLGRNLRRFCAGDDDVPPPILALTGTASPRVLNDLLDELGLDRSEEGVLHRPESFDRPNLHYGILRGDVSDRESNFSKTLEQIAQSLGVEIQALAEPRGVDTISGIVFVPHSSSGLKLGVIHYRDLVASGLSTDEHMIALFAGTKPRELSGLSRANWEENKAKYADAFRRNELPVMVSTNAFGMGIDKPNIRYTIHVTQPSSIEAFAQEAGRSGRDGQDSFCWLVSSNNPGINEDTIDRKATVDTAYAKDDLLIQISNLMSSFPSPAEEKFLAKKVLFELLETGEPGREVGIPHNVVVHPSTTEGNRAKDDEERDREQALYRLLLLGVVDDYTTDYGAGTYAVQLNLLDPGEILATARDLVTKMAGGSHRFASALDGLDGGSLLQVLPQAIDCLVDALYGTVEPGRTNALREMYLMTRLDDPEAIREKINAYLSEGPVALILDKVVRSESTLSETLQQLEETPQSSEEWAGAATRYLEAYAGHPVLLAVRALGEAWRTDGSQEEFSRTVESLSASLPEFGMAQGDQIELLAWVLGQLRTYFSGRRWAWSPDIWSSIEESEIDQQVIDALENHALARAAQGYVHPEEIGLVVAYRLRRHQSAVEPVIAAMVEAG